MLNFPTQWGKYNSKGVWHSAEAEGFGALSTRNTKNAPSDEAFAEQLEDAISVWADFHDWRLQRWPDTRANRDLNSSLELFKKLNEGLQKRRREQESQASNANINSFFTAGASFAKVYEKFLRDHIETRPAKAQNARRKLNLRINTEMNAANNNNKPAYIKMKKLKASVNKKIFG
jgi:hypothetical protein